MKNQEVLPTDLGWAKWCIDDSLSSPTISWRLASPMLDVATMPALERTLGYD